MLSNNKFQNFKRLAFIALCCVLTVGLGLVITKREKGVEFHGPVEVVHIEENSTKTIVISARSVSGADARIAGAMATCSCVTGPKFPVVLKGRGTEQLEFLLSSAVGKLNKISKLRIRFSGACEGEAFAKAVNVSYRVFSSNSRD